MNTEEVLLEQSEEVVSQEEVNSEKYKELNKYCVSDEHNALIEKYNSLNQELIKEIDEELEKRKTAKKDRIVAEYSELDSIVEVREFLVEIVKQISEETLWGKYMKEELQSHILNASSHIYNRDEMTFDVPVYSKLAMIKKKRNLYGTLSRRFVEVVNKYAPVKQKEEALHPYEDE